MTWVPPRPEGFDYKQPDPVETRCPICNPNGMNRTGLKSVGYMGASTTCGYGISCPNQCKNGLNGKVSFEEHQRVGEVYRKAYGL